MHNANCYTPVKRYWTYDLFFKNEWNSLLWEFHQCRLHCFLSPRWLSPVPLGSNSLCITMWGGNEWPSTHNRLENLFRLQIASTFHYLCCKAGNNAEEYIFILACGGTVQWPLGSIEIRGVPNSDFCRIRIFCRIHFAESEYSAEHSALPNNEEHMFNQASVQCRCSIKRVTLYQ